MKATSLPATFAFLLLSMASHATVWRVNSIPRFATTCATCKTVLQDAVTLANPGDTIHVEAATTAYGGIVVNKTLTIIGPGYNHGVAATQNPNLQADPKYAKISGITFSSLAENSVISGIYIMHNSTGGGTGLLINASHITVDRCFFGFSTNSIAVNIRIPSTGISDINIRRCYLNSIVDDNNDNQIVTDLSITNNYFNGRIAFDAGDQFPNLLIANNTFNSNLANTFTNGTFVYNILAQGSVVLNNNDIHDNIAVSATGLPTTEGPTNQNGIIPLFVGTGSDDAKWKLQPNSPAIDYMDTNVQLGMYGGANPYILSGIPAIPTIYQLQTTVSTTVGGTVDVTLSTKTNN